MRNGLFTLLAFWLFFQSSMLMAQGANLEWAQRAGGAGGDKAWKMVVDDQGNSYITGYFEGTVDFDARADVLNLTSVGDRDIFIQKLDPNGNLLWAKSVGGTGFDEGSFIKVNNLGDIYVTGRFSGTADFNPGVAVNNLVSAGFIDVFVLKLNTNGEYIWAKGIGGGSPDAGTAMTLDNNNNIIIGGVFQSTVDFDPGIGVANLTSVGGVDNFILKLDGNGNYIWSKSIEGTADDYIYGLEIDVNGRIYVSGRFEDTADFDPGLSVFNITSNGGDDIFILKLDINGNYIWVRTMGSSGDDMAYSSSISPTGSLYVAGQFQGTVDFDPTAGVVNLVSAGGNDVFLQKLDPNGNLIWVKAFARGTSGSYNNGLKFHNNSLYLLGSFQGIADFDPTAGTLNLTSNGGYDIFIEKLDTNGTFQWVNSMGGTLTEYGYEVGIDNQNNIFATGSFQATVDFDPNASVYNLVSSGGDDFFVVKFRENGTFGRIYNDFNQNCVLNNNEGGLAGRVVIINPGNIVAMSNLIGIWAADALPAGNYTITVDTSSPSWQSTCPITQNFTSTGTAIVAAPNFGFITTSPCTSPDVSIFAPVLRPGFSNQRVYVGACNESDATGILNNAFVIVELDPLLSVQSASMAYTSLGNDQYRVNLGNIYPGYCVDFWFDCTLATPAVLGQTLCLEATVYPIDSCILDTIPTPYSLGNVSPCLLPWDRSSLQVEGYCVGDSVRFVIYNTGVLGGGDMDCYAPVRVYLDGAWVMLDSIQLQGGDSIVYMFAGNAQTWRLEADQHPLHPGNSHPNATVENCGTGNWTPNLVNTLPQDDADPQVDIYCGVVTGSHDPNDKTGYPLGVGSNHDILPNQEMEYVIRFQNTGTDTAFTVVIRDTLSTDLDIFSVRPSLSSHDYTFKMYGPRVLEWTFNNIMLPDSNVNEPASHGFVKFKVNQVPNLPQGTVIENSVAIYFDFNAPIFTNTSWHTITESFVWLSVDKTAVEADLQIKIYPNPTTGIVHIDRGNNEEITIFVMDNLGRVVLSQQSNDTITNLNLSNLATGIYYIAINNGKQIATQKIVKQ